MKRRLHDGAVSVSELNSSFSYWALKLQNLHSRFCSPEPGVLFGESPVSADLRIQF
jgi:hypothetical protein